MLRVAPDGDVMARQGAMVAYQGRVDFAYQGAGGVFNTTFTGTIAITSHGTPVVLNVDAPTYADIPVGGRLVDLAPDERASYCGCQRTHRSRFR